jgi:hypothetical protein
VTEWDMVMCPQRSWVDGFQTMIQPDQRNEDDTALNGLKLFSDDSNQQNRMDINVYKGLWGDWADCIWLASRLNRTGTLLELGFEFNQSKEVRVKLIQGPLILAFR